MERKVEPVRRVERVSDETPLEWGRCWACGAETRGGRCSAHCAMSREQEQADAQTRGDVATRFDVGTEE